MRFNFWLQACLIFVSITAHVAQEHGEELAGSGTKTCQSLEKPSA